MNAAERAETLSEWRELVNVSASDLESYLQRWGQIAGLSRSEARDQGVKSGRDSARAIVRMKRKAIDKWTSRDWEWARAQVSFIRRMRGTYQRGAPLARDGKPTRLLLSLVLWGHDPDGSMRWLLRIPAVAAK